MRCRIYYDFFVLFFILFYGVCFARVGVSVFFCGWSYFAGRSRAVVI